MKNDILGSLTRLPDDELVGRVKRLIARERDVTAELIAHLAELETREVYLREGYPSLFVYCRDALGLSEWEAYNRIEVARAARRFPLILEMLGDGSVHLTAVRLLAPHLTPGNHREVLESARGKRKSEVEEILARLSPRPDVPCSVRRVATARSETPTEPEAVFDSDAASAPLAQPVPSAPAAASDLTALTVAGHVPTVHAAAVTPLSPDRYKLELTISGATLEKLRFAEDMLAHALPSGNDAVIVDRALTMLVADLAKKKFADTPKPRRSDGRKPGARSPSAAVKRAVWVRDLGRCAFVGATGHRCDERRFVEFHHVDPYALGGEATADGIQLRCRRHNDYEGRLYFGKRRPARELVPEQVRLSAPRST